MVSRGLALPLVIISQSLPGIPGMDASQRCLTTHSPGRPSLVLGLGSSGAGWRLESLLAES